MPAIFFGHGNPMNALQRNVYTEGWARIGNEIPRPSAVLCVSAHWYISSTKVTAMAAPRTIHDFGGFPRELYEVTYPAPGDPTLASCVQALLAPIHVARTNNGASIMELVGALSRPPASRYSRSTTQYRRNATGRISLRSRAAARAVARRRRADYRQRQPGPQSARLRLGTARGGALRLGCAL